MDYQYPPCAWNACDGYNNTDQAPSYYYCSPPPPPYSMPDIYQPWTWDMAVPAACTCPCCAPTQPYHPHTYAHPAAARAAPIPTTTTSQAAATATAAAKPKREYANKHNAPSTTPPPLRPGTRILHAPGEHVELRLLDGRPWADDAPQQQQLAFESVAAPAGLTVRELVARLGGGKGFAIGEAVEVGAGVWRAGIVVKEGDEAMGKGIARVGWTKRREEAGPIWVAVWKP